MTADNYADRIRKTIQHENTLENNRLQWMLIAQGLLFTALGTSLGQGISPDSAKRLKYILSVAGILTGLSVYAHLIQGRIAIDKTLSEFKAKHPNYNGPRVIGLDVQTLPTVFRYITPPYVLPLVFIIAWIAVAVLIV